MLVSVRVTANAKKPSIKKTAGGYIIKIDAPPEGGKANARLIKMMSDYLGISRSSVRIVRGHRSREKVMEIIP